ncbi:MAG: SIR2 family protein [Candidatus Aminicenantes bacterium]|nr:SIR2 family protein [Candidatus Aminicenantes bacterium]
MELTRDSAYKALQAIFKKKILLIIGTGASCAIDPRFGMPALADELKKKIPGEISANAPASAQWKTVEENLDNGKDLETSLNGINNKELLTAIIRVTGNFIAKIDRENKLKIMSGEKEPPLEKLIQAMIEGLPESDPLLDIITPNYDLLIEHTCDKLKIPYCTGFLGGIRKPYDWDSAAAEMVYIKSLVKAKKKVEVKRLKKHIRLHKVHGSINRFGKGMQGFEDNSLVYDNTCSDERGIITPGDTKHENVALHYRDFFTHADEAIPGAGAYIFVGYGFNDVQIELKIKEELGKKDKPGIIITRTLSSNAKEWLKKSKNLWAIYQETGADKNPNACIENGQFKKPLIIQNSRIWQIDTFTKEVLQGD